MTSVGNFQRSAGPRLTTLEGNWELIFLQFYVYHLRFKAWEPTTFLLSFKHWVWQYICMIRLVHCFYTMVYKTWYTYSISQEICTRFLLSCVCCGYTLTDFPISIRLTSLALWKSNDCPSASKTTLMNMDKYFMSIHYERLHNHNKAKHNKTVCIFLGIYCTYVHTTQHGYW